MEDINKRVLYVCRANFGRSQVAMSIHNQYRPGMADSAGTLLIRESRAARVGDWSGSEIVIDVMKNRGVDIASNERKPISRELAKQFGHIIVMAEIPTMPVYLLQFHETEFWRIDDLKNKDLTECDRIIGDLETKVVDLIDRIES